MSGIEWVVEAYGCSAQSLRDPAVLQNLFSRIIREMKLRPLAESHLACHTFPEHGSLCLNLFCCVPRAEWDFESILRDFFAADTVSVRRLQRPYESKLKRTAGH